MPATASKTDPKDYLYRHSSDPGLRLSLGPMAVPDKTAVAKSVDLPGMGLKNRA